MGVGSRELCLLVCSFDDKADTRGDFEKRLFMFSTFPEYSFVFLSTHSPAPDCAEEMCRLCIAMGLTSGLILIAFFN